MRGFDPRGPGRRPLDQHAPPLRAGDGPHGPRSGHPRVRGQPGLPAAEHDLGAPRPPPRHRARVRGGLQRHGRVHRLPRPVFPRMVPPYAIHPRFDVIKQYLSGGNVQSYEDAYSLAVQLKRFNDSHRFSTETSTTARPTHLLDRCASSPRMPRTRSRSLSRSEPPLDHSGTFRRCRRFP